MALAWQNNFFPHILIIRGMTFRFEYLSEFEFIFENNLGAWSWAQELAFDEKKWRSKISCKCTFKQFLIWLHFANILKLKAPSTRKPQLWESDPTILTPAPKDPILACRPIPGESMQENSMHVHKHIQCKSKSACIHTPTHAQWTYCHLWGGNSQISAATVVWCWWLKKLFTVNVMLIVCEWKTHQYKSDFVKICIEKVLWRHMTAGDR